MWYFRASSVRFRRADPGIRSGYRIAVCQALRCSFVRKRTFRTVSCSEESAGVLVKLEIFTRREKNLALHIFSDDHYYWCLHRGDSASILRWVAMRLEYTVNRQSAAHTSRSTGHQLDLLIINDLLVLIFRRLQELQSRSRGFVQSRQPIRVLGVVRWNRPHMGHLWREEDCRPWVRRQEQSSEEHAVQPGIDDACHH